MLMLGNSTRGLFPHLECLLYISCVLPVMTYGYRLWFYKNSPCKNHIKLLSKTQCQAALWITGTFHTSPTGGVETIAGLLPVHLQLRKLKNKSFLRNKKLHSSHSTLLLFSLLWGEGRGIFSIDQLTLGWSELTGSPGQR